MEELLVKAMQRGAAVDLFFTLKGCRVDIVASNGALVATAFVGHDQAHGSHTYSAIEALRKALDGPDKV
jgi:hypothetical protein